MALQYLPFRNVARIRNAAANAPAMGWGERGAGVGILQGALQDLGYKLPVSIKAGKPDGIFGKETYGAVRSFQGACKNIGIDGVAGKNTWARLDAAMVKKHPPKPAKPKPPKPPPPVMTAEYKLGTADPPIKPDPGSGPWNTQPTEASYVALKGAILGILPAAAFKLGDDAAKHMLQFFRNTGADYRMDLEGMIGEVKVARKRYESEVGQAKIFVERLPAGVHDFTSRKLNGAYATKSQSVNWYYAIGGFTTWGKGKATVRDGPSGRSYAMEFEYKFFDRYNWDGGKKVTIDVPGLGPVVVTDAFMQNFHRQGLAREFNCIASFKRTFSWKHGQAIPTNQY